MASSSVEEKDGFSWPRRGRSFPHLSISINPKQSNSTHSSLFYRVFAVTSPLQKKRSEERGRNESGKEAVTGSPLLWSLDARANADVALLFLFPLPALKVWGSDGLHRSILFDVRLIRGAHGLQVRPPVPLLATYVTIDSPAGRVGPTARVMPLTSREAGNCYG